MVLVAEFPVMVGGTGRAGGVDDIRRVMVASSWVICCCCCFCCPGTLGGRTSSKEVPSKTRPNLPFMAFIFRQAGNWDGLISLGQRVFTSSYVLSVRIRAHDPTTFSAYVSREKNTFSLFFRFDFVPQ